MRLVSCEIGGEHAYGMLIGDRIARLDMLPGAAPDLKSYLEVAHAAGWPPVEVEADIPLDRVRLLPPIPNPDKVICVATNFREPAREGQPEPEYPLVFTRFANSFTGHEWPLIKPDHSEKYDFEGELAVVIGKRGRKISADAAMEYVAGYCCLNDGSVRDWQKHSSQFTPGKNFYRSGSFGPWLVTADEVPDPGALTLRTRVNGEIKQQIGMDRMIFDIAWLIAYFSTFTELVPGDVIATGTPSGFGSSRTPPEFLSIGDEIEVEIAGIGTLHNIVGGEQPSG
ncbi:fumarylacetoacetate hydrolase family protein [Sphingomonas sp. C8-2]|jgi:2-keto-4-pentenoate hydratase/2-oxohepta-3-ene-1,7-dioic acid hydratase in catechol pathway|uniref:2-keto-4-pentenoate hydratase/2-oxohepta-3-ene-1,7-dioic acid hydratase (Catechol pathway) n=2 Tax=Rhizorhabdus histidinilytica TaxID=439228 RepID=A0A1T5EJX8_9SPHN|nr:fumarylacetoacetate hydrolase family protein [Sphingomonas sp. C8-2]SKB84352.1 2-keto-4-pentenoate hydratase/2-oxohepta-3-ene-1,7-dioic acid hydratase (catechol pathway) [Rhizorhabdus histidinilytica]